ncbi:hypothetical protein F2P79_006251 [Pimephales promelas]|nr:hypothetical protein F2P79_006251 [Pimephales promelas]
MCAELHIGLSFIYPVLLNVCDMLKVTESDLGSIRSFKDMVRKELIKRFKLESDILADSIPITACMLDPRFKHLKFLPENIRADALAHLTQLLTAHLDHDLDHKRRIGGLLRGCFLSCLRLYSLWFEEDLT